MIYNSFAFQMQLYVTKYDEVDLLKSSKQEEFLRRMCNTLSNKDLHEGVAMQDLHNPTF